MYGIATASYFFSWQQKRLKKCMPGQLPLAHIPVCARPNEKNCNELLKSFPRQQFFTDGQNCKLSDALLNNEKY